MSVYFVEIHRLEHPLQKHHPLFSFFFIYLRMCLGIGEEMTDFLAGLYPWTKAFHIMSVIAWMAGLFYLPRVFVYHAEKSEPGDQLDEVFQTMEVKLLRVIMNPAMIATWVFGLMLVFTPGIVDWFSVWPYTKASGIILLTWFHHWLGYRRKDFLAGQNRLTGRQYRLMNELPTLAMVLIVLSVVIRF